MAIKTGVESGVLFRSRSTERIEEIERRLHESAARHKFGVIAVHDLRETMHKKGVELGMECRIYEVCNPVQAKKVLEADGAVSTALPCRISVYGHPGAYTLATMLPGAMLQAFDKPEIAPVAEEVEAVIVQMIRDAGGA